MLIRSVRDEGPGSYLIRRPGNGAGGFALWREGVSESLADLLMEAVNRRPGRRGESAASANTSSSNTFDLHAAQQRAGETDTETITYQALRWMQPEASPPQIPYTFPPACQVPSKGAATSHAEQARAEAQAAAAQLAAEDRKKPCRHFRQGACKFGSNCKWSHDVEPVRVQLASSVPDHAPGGPAARRSSQRVPPSQNADAPGSGANKGGGRQQKPQGGRGKGERGTGKAGGKGGRGRGQRNGRGGGPDLDDGGGGTQAMSHRGKPVSIGNRPGGVERPREATKRLRSQEEGDRSVHKLRDS